MIRASPVSPPKPVEHCLDHLADRSVDREDQVTHIGADALPEPSRGVLDIALATDRDGRTQSPLNLLDGDREPQPSTPSRIR